MAGDGGDGPTAGAGEVETLQAAAALSVAGLLVAFHRAMPQLYALNFDTGGPGPTAALVVVLVSGWTVPLLVALRGDGAGSWPGLLGVAGGLGLAASLIPHAGLAVAAGLAAFPLLTPGLVALSERLGPGIGVGLAGGVLLQQALRALTGGAPLPATPRGRILALGLAAALAWAWWSLRARGWDPSVPETGLAADAAPLMAAVLAEAAFLGSPDAPAAWLGVPRLPVAVASAAGLAAGAAAVTWGPTPGEAGQGFWAGVVVLAAADAAAWGLLQGLAVLPAQVGLVLVVAAAARREGNRTAGLVGVRVSVVQAVAVAALLGLVWAGNWAFVPGGTLARGRAPLLLALLLAWPAMAAVVTGARVRRWVG